MDDPRSVRLFVSSTFADMHEERDALANLAFGRIRAECWRRGLSFAEIDLRWGITREEAGDGRVMELCLAEVERCAPFFVAILGRRYGWVDPAAKADPGALPEHLRPFADRSITELEIRHAAFVARRSSSSAGVVYLETGGEDDEGPDADALRRLRAELGGLGFTTREPYRSAADLASRLESDVVAMIDRYCGPVAQASAAHGSETAHRSHLARSLFASVGRAGDRPDGALLKGKACVLFGPPGSGKTVSVAQCLGRLEEAPRGESWLAKAMCRLRGADRPVKSLYSSFGLFPADTDWPALLHDLMSRLPGAGDFDDEPEADPDRLPEQCAAWVSRASEGARLVLAIDDIDRWCAGVPHPDLSWLSALRASGAALLAATGRRDIRDLLAGSGWETVEVRPLAEGEGARIVEAYFGSFGKRLDEGQTAALMRMSDRGSPAALRAAMNELRLFGRFEDLDAELGQLAAGSGLAAERLIDRFARSWPQVGQDRLDRMLGALVLARDGLEEAELRAIGGGDPVPAHVASALLLALDEFIARRAGRIAIASACMRAAIAGRLGPDHEKPLRRELSRLLETTARPARRAFEVPFQHAKSGDWAGLEAWLTRPANAAAVWSINDAELAAWCAALRAEGRASHLAAFRETIAGGADPSEVLAAVAGLMTAEGAEAMAAPLEALAERWADATAHGEALPRILMTLAELARRNGDPERAAHWLRRTLPLEGARSVRTELLTRLGLVLFEGGLPDAAIAALEAALGPAPGPAALPGTGPASARLRCEAMGRLGAVLLVKGEAGRAERLFAQQEMLARRWGISHELGTALLNKAVAIGRKGSRAAAESLLAESEKVFARTGNRAGLAHCSDARVQLLAEAGDFNGAMLRVDAGLEQALTSGHEPDQIRCLLARADLLRRMNASAACRADLRKASALAASMTPRIRAQSLARISAIERELRSRRDAVF